MKQITTPRVQVSAPATQTGFGFCCMPVGVGVNPAMIYHLAWMQTAAQIRQQAERLEAEARAYVRRIAASN